MKIKTLLQQIPKEPGVYLFKNKENKIIYVGKAKNLKKRVSSYFNKKPSSQSIKTQVLVKNITDIDYIVVDNELEALLLENKLIKKHSPQYNIMLKDSKTYSYIALSADQFPRIYSTRIKHKGAQLFGPYVGGLERVQVRRLAARIFGIRTCRNLPKRACLRYHMGICSAPCINKISKEDYAKQVKHAAKFLKGDNKEVLKLLEKEMNNASEKQLYEQAIAARDNIAAIKYLEEKQKVDTIKDYDQDVIAILHNKNKAIIQLFSISRGVISGKKHYYFDYKENLLEEFLSSYYTDKYVPHEIIVNQEFAKNKKEHEEIKEFTTKALSALSKRKVKIIKPQKGEKKALLQLAEKNAKLNFEGGVLKEIQKQLNLPNMPHIIECFDISNLGDQFIVGGMTQWVGGRANPAGNRRFQINTVKEQDDFAAMAEMVQRRYAGLLRRGQMLPDLIIIDGGKGQLSSAHKELKKLNVNIPIIGLAKQEEEIFMPGKKESYNFNNNSPMMLLIRKIRDSVHKYVLAYNRKKRSMALRDEMKD